MEKTFAWTTARGAKISATITVEHVTRDTINSDGFKVEVDCNKWFRQVDAMTVNGKPTELKELWDEAGKQCILIARKGKDRVLVALPADVENAIYGEERERILKAMNP